MLQDRGVQLPEIAELVVSGQKDRIPDLSLATAIDSIQHVLHKPEVQDAVMTGFALDDVA